MKKYLVAGATGTLGRAIVRKLLEDPNNTLVCLSRDEFKQSEMKKHYPNEQRLKFVLGDIRDLSSLEPHFQGVHTVFHVAALKQIDTMEANPIECVKTNLLGTINVAEAAIRAKVSHVVFSSTDKAVLPINTYGMCKAASEKVLLHKNKEQTATRFCIFRWGNVLASRGSVVHAFERSLKKEGVAHVTDQHMTRFWIQIEDAVTFMLKSYLSCPLDDVLIPQMKGAHVTSLVKAIASCLKLDNYQISEIGMRPGEKIHEVIDVDSRGGGVSSNTASQYTHAELMELVQPILNQGSAS